MRHLQISHGCRGARGQGGTGLKAAPERLRNPAYTAPVRLRNSKRRSVFVILHDKRRGQEYTGFAQNSFYMRRSS